MDFKKTAIDGLVIIEPTLFKDDRGYFMESFKLESVNKIIGSKIKFIQDNESMTAKNVLRGLHFQVPPFAQSKLVRVVSGSIIDIAVDVRKGSPTFCKYVSIELSDKNKKQLFIPRGFAHGFLALEDNTIVTYKVDNYYSKIHDSGIKFDDNSININWGDKSKFILSKKDASLKNLNDIDISFFHYNLDLYE